MQAERCLQCKARCSCPLFPCWQGDSVHRLPRSCFDTLYVYVCACACVCVSVHLWAHTCVCLRACACVCVRVRVHLWAHAYQALIWPHMTGSRRATHWHVITSLGTAGGGLAASTGLPGHFKHRIHDNQLRLLKPACLQEGRTLNSLEELQVTHLLCTGALLGEYQSSAKYALCSSLTDPRQRADALA